MNCPNKYSKEFIMKNIGTDEFDRKCKCCENYVYDQGIAYCKFADNIDNELLEKLSNAIIEPLKSEIPIEFIFNKDKEN